MAEQFIFYECTALVRMTGRSASDLVEFVEIIKRVSAESIFHHMHQYFMKPHVRPPEYPNDFAEWAADALEDKTLAERLANLNPFEFSSIEGVRGEIVRVVEDHMRKSRLPRPVVMGKEFFFNDAVTLVIPTGFEASTLEEFVTAFDKVDSSSIYFHFYEARLRLGKEEDDFSRYFADSTDLNCPDLPKRIKTLDPYMYSTEVLRSKIKAMVELDVCPVDDGPDHVKGH